MSGRIDLQQLAARESEQVEWKGNVADVDDVVETLSAFANDLANLGGGYVVCGAAETKDDHGFPSVELTGLTPSRLKEVEGIVLTRCRERVSPPLAPLVEELPAATPDRRVLAFIMASTDQAHMVRRGAQGARYFVRITVFEDRIEMISPGPLPVGVDPGEFRAGRAAPKWRNQALAWFLNRLQFAQAEGQGIPTVLRSMQQEGCPPPVFTTSDARVICTLCAHPRHTAPAPTTERDRWKVRLLEIINRGGTGGTPFEALSRAFPTATRNDLRVLLRELRKAGRIHVLGATKAARWFPGSEQP